MDSFVNGFEARPRFKRPIVILIITILASLHYSTGARNEVICSSIDIRNSPYFGTSSLAETDKSKLDCTIIEGDFTLSMITEDNISDDMFPVFKNLREITGAILIFQIKGLTNLGRMFPNLRVIGGHTLIMNYALVIYQNQDLRNIGLTKLTVIKNGGIRISENSRLCYTRNINWDNIIVGNIRDVILDTTESQCQDQCIVADESKCDHARQSVVSCWNSSDCQTYCPHHTPNENGTFGPGCADSNGEACHPYCFGGCSVPNDPGACNTCRYVEIDGICARRCPDTMYQQSGRKCLTEEQCHSLKMVTGTISSREESVWKAFDGVCHYECPSGYKEDPTNKRNCVKCQDRCPKRCRGDENIDSVGAALKFKNCNIIDGYLEIEIRIGSETNVEKFTEAFGEIEEITDYLSEFRNLRVIHGNRLSRGGYSLVVFDNPNLRELFKRENITIVKGKVQFQNNRMLCYNKIEAFLNNVGKSGKVTDDVDVSSYSNGDRAICDEVPLDVSVHFVLSDGFSIRWAPFDTTNMDHRKFMGYQIFYKKVDRIDEELSINEDRSACADTWKMHFVDGRPSNDEPFDDNRKPQITGELINGMESNTLYAFYVQTRSISHIGARTAISKVHFVRTNFGTPDPPRIRVYQARGSDRIEMRWDPPVNPHGVITHYTVQWQPPEPNNHWEELNGCADEIPKSVVPEVLMSKKTKKPGTCSQEGCCDCSLINTSNSHSDRRNPNSQDVPIEEIEMNRENNDAFENTIQDKIFVQSCDINKKQHRCSSSFIPVDDLSSARHTKRRRHTNNKTGKSTRLPTPPPFKIRSGEGKPRGKRKAYYDDVPINQTTIEEIINNKEKAFDINMLNVSDPSFSDEFRANGKINITGNRILLTGLPHFTEFVILVYACQDVTQPDNSCSRPAWMTVRTATLPENDKVLPHTIRVMNITNGKENDRRFDWAPPVDPNGKILAYKVKLFRGHVENAPLYKCINRSQFAEEGVIFTNLAGGTYSIEIRTVTLAGTGLPTLVKNIVSINVPIMSKKAAIILGVCLLFATLVVAGISYFIFKYFCQRISEDKVHQLLSSNPEYLNQVDVYKKDEWELPRDRIVLGKEIGSGTFGKVYRGVGNGVKSVTGVVFGECAIKTVSEANANMDRFHFLIEASVMKQFNTNHIVKLYGIISDAPVLVVMELMEKGNLRDFLRAHRPGSDESTETRYNLPSPMQYYQWAAQIADGMGYLESLRFCHRDLAARNCMVTANETVKIGDFGMARDIYYHEYYKPQGRRLMPIRWLSPESLKDGKFTLKSDVWSFGVVLYEMLTLGQQPYAGLANSQVFKYVCLQKKVMGSPKNCPKLWYNMMRACWIYEEKDRPCFWQIVEYLRDVTDKTFHRDSFVFNETKLKKDEEAYNFDRDWPKNEIPVDGVDPDSDSETYDDEIMGMISSNSAMNNQMFKMQMKDKNRYLEECCRHGEDLSCSCSSGSDSDAPEFDNYLDEIQRRNVRDYLDSMVLPGHDPNDMDLEKANERDLECLIPDNQTDEEDFLIDHSRDVSQSFGNQSTASASQLNRSSRHSLNEDDKDAVREALKGIRGTEADEAPWFKQKGGRRTTRFDPKMDDVSGDYLMTTNTTKLNVKPSDRASALGARQIELLREQIEKRQKKT